MPIQTDTSSFYLAAGNRLSQGSVSFMNVFGW